MSKGIVGDVQEKEWASCPGKNRGIQIEDTRDSHTMSGQVGLISL